MSNTEQIREIWQEIKELDRLRNSPGSDNIKSMDELSEKFEDIDILFGHESTLSKAIIYYLNNIS